MKLRIFALVSLLTLVSAANASFELLLVGDNGANTTPTRRMHRFDGITGTYLGAFGNFDSDIKAVTLRQSANQVFVQTTNRLFILNYNTGELINDFSSFNVGGMCINPTNNYLYYVNGQSILRESLANLDAGTFNPQLVLSEPGASLVSNIAITNNGTIVTGQIRAGATFQYRYDSSLVGSVSATWSAAVQLNQNGVSSQGRVTQALTYLGHGYVEKFDQGGNYSGENYSATLSTGIATAPGHVGEYLVGTDFNNSALGSISRFSASGGELYQFGGSVLRKPAGMVSVIAPEPGSLAVLGLGLAVLVRRRK